MLEHATSALLLDNSSGKAPQHPLSPAVSLPPAANQLTAGRLAQVAGSGALLKPASGAVTELPDLLLVERARAHDAQALQKLMERYNRRLFRVTRSILQQDDLAEAAVQATYERAIAELDRCEPSGRFGTWLTRLAFNEAQALYRPGATATAAAATLSAAASGAMVVADRDVERAIDALPQVFRTVLVLRVTESLSGVEVAACLGLHETTVRTRLYRALHRMSAEIVRHLQQSAAHIFDLPAERSTRIITRVLARQNATPA